MLLWLFANWDTNNIRCQFAVLHMADSDNLYFKILRELVSSPGLRKSGRESYVELAKKLGVDDQTVRSTLGRMQKSGFLKTWSASLNPHVFGMECESVIFRSGRERRHRRTRSSLN